MYKYLVKMDETPALSVYKRWGVYMYYKYLVEVYETSAVIRLQEVGGVHVQVPGRSG